ncbi:MAG: penicillin-binding protein 2 [Abditibacteriota bacterium]|nr:penicillin-binding protein 2 [Abditibacteriota bacterium]
MRNTYDAQPFEIRSRIYWLAFVFALVVAALGFRLWYLQIKEGRMLLEAANNNRIRIIRTKAPRGNILDARGIPIAQSKKLFIISAIPEKFENKPEELAEFCHILGISRQDYHEIVNNSSLPAGAPVRIAVDVPFSTIVTLGEHRMLFDGVVIENDFVRHYPRGRYFSHLTGYLREISGDSLKAAREQGKQYRMGDYVGVFGLEKYYEDQLRGVDGGQRIEVNAAGRVVKNLGQQQSVPGNTLHLTVDSRLQKAAWDALDGKTGALAAVEPGTGRVLAMVSRPDFDPNIFVRGLKSSDWNKLVEDKEHPLINRAAGSVYPPGSTFKPLISASILQNKAASVYTTVVCPGYYRLGTYRKGCWTSHGRVDFSRAVSESCDVWFYAASVRLGIDKIYETSREFGLGLATGIDLPEEPSRDGKTGLVPDPDWLEEHAHRKWMKGDTLNVSIGQGDVLASPLQMACAISCIANGGTLYRPYLLDRVTDSSGAILCETKPEKRGSVSVSAQVLEQISAAMERTVSSGTGKAAAIPGVRIAGKTGSAQAAGGPAHGWFVCFAPAEAPRIAIACIVERGSSGSGSAGPVVRAVLESFFDQKKGNE